MKPTRLGMLLLCSLATAGAWSGPTGEARGAEAKRYVGSAVCGECHDLQYENYLKHAKKARSYESVAVMKDGLTEEEYRNCLECHATGYGKPGGFVSPEETPELKDAGCEACHGPGSVHVETNDIADIRASLTVEDCQRCHNEDRVRSFDFKPLLFGGAH